MGVAQADIVTGWLAMQQMVARQGLLLFGLVFILSAITLTVVSVQETLP